MNRLCWVVYACAAANLVACDTPPKKPESIPSDPVTVNVDSRLLTECAVELPTLKTGRDVEVLELQRLTLLALQKCAAEKKALNAEVKKAFNIK